MNANTGWTTRINCNDRQGIHLLRAHEGQGKLIPDVKLVVGKPHCSLKCLQHGTSNRHPAVRSWIEQCFRPRQHRLYERRFLQVKRPNQQYQSTEGTHSTQTNQTYNEQTWTQNTTSPVYTNMGWLLTRGTAPTEGRVARPERRWDCRRGTPGAGQNHYLCKTVLTTFMCNDTTWLWSFLECCHTVGLGAKWAFSTHTEKQNYLQWFSFSRPNTTAYNSRKVHYKNSELEKKENTCWLSHAYWTITRTAQNWQSSRHAERKVKLLITSISQDLNIPECKHKKP